MQGYRADSVRDTGKMMRFLADTYYQDMAPYATMSLLEVFDLVRKIPYRADPPEVEFLQRPMATLNGTGWGGDCDDKAICMAAWAKLNGIPYRFLAVSGDKNRPVHHVLTLMYIGGNWVPVDPTYSHYTLGRTLERYARRELI